MRYVHIGFPKTATTYLQQVVFPRITRGMRYVDAAASARCFRSVIEHDDTIFDPRAARRLLDGAMDGHEHALFSYEPLTGLEYRSGFVNRTPIAHRLRLLGFDRVIITIRNQFDALESAYKQYVCSGGVLTFDDYVGFDPDRTRYFYPEYFDYGSIYRLYTDLFGSPGVLVLQYERMHQPAFVRSLCEFLGDRPVELEPGSPVNASLSRTKTRILRVVNHVTCNAHRPSHLISKRISTSAVRRLLALIPALEGGGSFLSPAARRHVDALFADSNAALARAAGIVLAPEYPASVAQPQPPFGRPGWHSRASPGR